MALRGDREALYSHPSRLNFPNFVKIAKLVNMGIIGDMGQIALANSAEPRKWRLLP